MSNWYVGQKVVCIVSGGQWFRASHLSFMDKTIRFFTKRLPRSIGPELNEVCEVSAVVVRSDCGFGLGLNEYPQDRNYPALYFRPLEPLKEEMDRIESEGAPVEEPEPQHV